MGIARYLNILYKGTAKCKVIYINLNLFNKISQIQLIEIALVKIL